MRFGTGRFSFLLVSVVFAFAVSPFLEGFAGMQIVTDIYLSAIFLSAIPAASDRKHSLFIALALALPYLLLKWADALFGLAPLRHWEELFAALFLAYILTLILSFIARQREITGDIIMAAVCGYFMLGYMWGFLYFLLESVRPGSFLTGQGGADASHFIYFSFVTMTTVGYGDTLPLTNAARSLAILEAVMGQLYLAVTIARLVGIQSSQKKD